MIKGLRVGFLATTQSVCNAFTVKPGGQDVQILALRPEYSLAGHRKHLLAGPEAYNPGLQSIQPSVVAL